MFSVVVPAYNHEQFISRTIDSVLAQDFSDFELIIVDDGSIDTTAERVRSYADPRIRLIVQANAGEAGARNAGIALACHEWLAFLDGDDYWFPNHLSEVARVVAMHPSVGFVSTSCASGSEWQATRPDDTSDLVECSSFFKLAGRDLSVVYPSSAVIRRSVVAAVGNFSSLRRRGTDQEYWARVGLVTPLAHSHAKTVYYYQHPDSIMALDRHRREMAPDRIEDMWPSVQIIRSAQRDAKYRHLVDDFDLYERQTTYLSMIGYMSRREFAVARRLAVRMPVHKLDRAAAIALLLRLPDALLNLLLEGKQRLRRAKFRSRA